MKRVINQLLAQHLLKIYQEGLGALSMAHSIWVSRPALDGNISHRLGRSVATELKVAQPLILVPFRTGCRRPEFVLRCIANQKACRSRRRQDLRAPQCNWVTHFYL